MTHSKAILMVDHNARNLELLSGFLRKQGYEPRPVTSLDAFGAVFACIDEIGLALVDISGFDRGVWAYCERLSDNNVPFIVISPKQAAAIREEGRSHGARDVLIKPLVAQELSSLINGLIGEE